jgi:predicted nucleotidyltransferase
MKTIYKSIFGSRLYGTDLPGSDHDYKGIFIPTASEILKPKIIETKNFSTGTSATKNGADDVDSEYFSVHKFLYMIEKGDMVATEMFFSPLAETTMEFEYIRSFKSQLISRKATGFVGYARRQASLYGAKGIRLKEVEKVVEYFSNVIQTKKLDSDPRYKEELTAITENKVHTKISYVEDKGEMVWHFECCDRKIPITVTANEAYKIYKRVLDEYGSRAKAAAVGEGIEWKSMMHAVRISFSAIEMLETGKITYPHPYASFLKEVRQGNIAFNIIEQLLEDNLYEIEKLTQTCTILPENTDVEVKNFIIESLYGNEVLTTWQAT